MRWSPVIPFGRHKGKTPPQTIVHDMDWFFWALPKFYGKLAGEVQFSRSARSRKRARSGRSRATPAERKCTIARRTKFYRRPKPSS
jgi:hypothetical protein